MNRILIALLIACLGALPMMADGGSTGTNVPRDIPIIHNPNNKNNRPKAPSLQSIYCWYDGETLYIDFALSEGWCQLTVIDEDDASVVFSSFDSSSSAEVYIGEHANASISISTESGNEYVGYIVN